MRVSKPLDSITSGTQLLILRQLSTHTDTELTETQLAELCGCSRQTIHLNLDSLVGEDLVLRRKVGNVNLLRTNPPNVMAQKIVSLFDFESRLKENLVNQLRDLWKSDNNIEMAYLFGSVARGEDTSRSDIDVYVVVDEMASFNEKYDKRLGELEHAFSKRISINLNDSVEFDLLGDEGSLIYTIFKEGIWLCGGKKLVLDSDNRLSEGVFK